MKSLPRKVPEVLHALSQPLQQELDVLRDVLIVVLLLFQVLQLLQHLALDHGQSVLLPGLPLCRLLQEILRRAAGSATLLTPTQATELKDPPFLIPD